MKNVIRNNKGFSLVELMVVVAIIGILAAMSVGQVQKQIAKSRQAEVKTSLANIYTSEKSIFTEHNAYSTSLVAIGSSFEGQMRYNVGFGAAGAAAPPTWTSPQAWQGAAATRQANDGAGNGVCLWNVQPTAAVPCAVIISNGTVPGALPAAATTVTAAVSTFLAQGQAAIYNNIIDTWTMDQTKQLRQTVNGIP